MAWFKVDDKLWGHPKWLAASPAARALWVTAGSWCSDHLTDGEIPTHVIQTLGGRTRDAVELCSLTLWVATDTGWSFGDWLDYQPSREQVEAEREAARQRQAKAREAAKLRREAERSNAGSHASSHGVTSPELPSPSRSPRPDPTRPDPTVVPTELPEEHSPTVSAAQPKSKATRLPDDWQPTSTLISWVKAECPDIDGRSHTDNFCDYWHSKSGRDSTKHRWDLAYRKWMRDEQSKARRYQRPTNGSGHSSTTDAKAQDALALIDRMTNPQRKALA